jgi:hypothetical protein
MSAIYWIAFIVGTGLLLFSALGHDGHDHDGGIDSHDGDHDGWNIFSVRNATYFLFAFGTTGALLSLLWRGQSSLVTLLLALMAGLFAGGAAAMVFSYLRRSQSGAMEDDDSLVGLAGHVVVPLSRAGLGKVVVTRGDREFELLARPFDTDADEPETWSGIVVVEMHGGTALVTPFRAGLEETDEVFRLPPKPE